jgi:polysaccharide export outer membrane protein
LFSGSAIAQQAEGGAEPERLYRVGPGDKLEILVWKDDYHSRQVVVQPDGYITFPLAGDVLAMNRTIPQIREEITRRLREYLPDTQIVVILEEANSYKIYVIGKVNSPGEFRSISPLSVLQALAMAGGFDNLAISNPNNINIIRKTPSGQKAIPFDYNDVKKGKNLQMNVTLQSGDVVVVP